MRLQSFTFALMTFAVAASAADAPSAPRIEQVTPRVSVIVADFNGMIRLGQTRERAQASVRLDQFVAIKDVGHFLTKKANVGWVYDELKRK